MSKVDKAPPSSPEGEPQGRENSQANGAWSTDRSAARYQIDGWGSPYFHVSEAGTVCVTPNPEIPQSIDLHELCESLKARGLAMPMLLRFSDILGHRIARLNEAFQGAIQEYGYTGEYTGVFPVKVNQQSHLIDDIVSMGAPYGYGLEAGSKPELLITLAAMRGEPGLIICNGYKDRAYIETALLAQRLDKTVIIVIERLEELDIAIEASQSLGIRPLLGVRSKLASKGVGRWANSAGDRAKFGVSNDELIELVDRLKAADMLDTLMLLHFHIGSQISSILPLKNALQEAANIYVELAKMGCKMGYLDVGGGLAVDYDGSRTDLQSSKNYDVVEYANDVVSSIHDACEKGGIADPTIVTESGRAVAAHHSVLIFEVVGVSGVQHGEPAAPPSDAPSVLNALYETFINISPNNVQESFHDASQARDEAQSLFRYGYLGLRDQALAERLFWHCCVKIQRAMRASDFVPEELKNLDETLAAIYYCNFSVFQSAPDIWAIDQLFPIMPIHRLDEEPTVKCTLADLTCDSDGVVNQFIDADAPKNTLDAHRWTEEHPYYLGMFLNGAYQEILGDLHNLFGDTNAAHVHLTEQGWEVMHVVKGDSVSEVLRYVQFDPDQMVERVRRQADRAVRAGRLDNEQMRKLMHHYEAALLGYTYLTD